MTVKKRQIQEVEATATQSPVVKTWEFKKEPGKVYLLRRTTTEEFAFDPDDVRDVWSNRDDRFRPFVDWVIDTFELHAGSVFADSYFCDTANMNVGVKLVIRGEDD